MSGSGVGTLQEPVLAIVATETFFVSLTNSVMAVLFLLLVTSLCVEVCFSQEAPINWGPDLYFRNYWPDSVSRADLEKNVTLMTCAGLCSTKPWCSSFFHRNQNNHCLLFKRIYVDRKFLRPQIGVDYYRIASDTCPIEKCYYLSRPDNMCFFLDLSPQAGTYNDSKAFCEDNHGRLAILDNPRKNVWIVELLKLHNALSGDRLYLGARLEGMDYIYRWSNGETLGGPSSSESFWNVPVQFASPCVVLEVQARQEPGTWKDSACNVISAQILCEYQITN
ncbi:uncharacterized protein [Littorina saxatilis]|uniref:uncharacterized protein n=1 Tax=Littorina saxatilis TaxID=31220 RepID=UPI0038B6A88A